MNDPARRPVERDARSIFAIGLLTLAPVSGRPFPMALKRKSKRYANTRCVAEAAALQERVTAGIATADEALKYLRLVNALRARFRSGQLSLASAQRFGIE